MTNKTELLPCPFCGGPGKLCVADYVHDDGSPWPIVECDTCHGWVPASVWNTRAAPAEDVRAVVDEPVAWIVTDMNGDSYFAYDKQTPADHPLYRHPQRPVVMPERRNVDPYNAETVLQWHKDREWNACLDEFSRLNPEISK